MILMQRLVTSSTRAIQTSLAKRLAVLEFSGPLDDTVLMMLSDEVRGVALKAVAEHHCSVMTRETGDR